MIPTSAALAGTRTALHQVAEHVLAAAQYAQTGRIRLAWVAGGFGTTEVLAGSRHLGVIDGRLVVTDGTAIRTAPLTTLRAAAEFVGSTAGLPATAYPAATPLIPDAPLMIDPASVRLLTDWYGLADRALRAFAGDVGAADRPVLWPEHFDLGISVDAVNYGASCGDDRIAAPYLYVGPHGGAPRHDDFWNADFGAARTIDQIGSVDAAIAFFRAGRSMAAGGSARQAGTHSS